MGIKATRVVGQAAAVAWLSAALGCQAPGVDTTVVWVDGSDALDATQGLRWYRDGEIFTRRVGGIPAAANLSVGVSSDRRGVLLTPDEGSTTFVDLEDGRTMSFATPVIGVSGAQPPQFSARGDAIVWIDGGRVHVVPTSPGLDSDLFVSGDPDDPSLPALPDGFVRPWSSTILGARTFTTAAAAPIVLVNTDAAYHVVRYATAERPWTSLEGTLRLPAQGEPGGSAQPVPDLFPPVGLCSAVEACGAQVLLAPLGDAVLASAGAFGCSHLWWRGAAATMHRRCVEQPAVFGSEPIALLALLDDQHAVVLADRQVFVWDLATGAAKSFPRVGGPPLAWKAVEDGQAISLVAMDGPVTRITDDSFEVVNVAKSLCTARAGRPPVFSADGRQVAWTCVYDDASVTSVIRVAGGRLRDYTGIVMTPVAIDNQGSLLLYSESLVVDDPQGVEPTSRPRTLYVLDVDDFLHRVDGLEPPPRPIVRVDAPGESIYFVAPP